MLVGVICLLKGTVSLANERLTLQGDLNEDGTVNLSDLVVLSSEWLLFSDGIGEDLLWNATFSRNSIASLDGKEYTANAPRKKLIAVCGLSDVQIHGEENVIGVGPVVLSPKCAAGGYIYATQLNCWNIYRSADGVTWERTADFVQCVQLIYGTQSGAILVAKPGGGVFRFYRSTVGGSDLSDYNLPPPVLTLGHTDSNTASVGFWNYHQARNGTICISEYGSQYGLKESRIYRSVDDGASFTQVYDEPDDIFHSHRIMKHEATGRWVNVYGDGPLRNKVVKSDDDGATWSTLDPQPDNHFQPVEFYEYGHATNLLYGSDAGGFIGTFNVLTREITPLYHDGNRITPFVFSIYYHDGVFYAGTFGTKWTTGRSGAAILASSDLVHWAVYHEFRNEERCVDKFLGVFDGKIHGVVTDSNGCWRHFSFTPTTVKLVNGLCLDPATINMLDNAQDSSIETDISNWSAAGTRERITTDAVHGSACLRVHGDSNYALETIRPIKKDVTVGKTYNCRVWLKANGQNLSGYVKWEIPADPYRYGLINYFCLSQDEWTEIVLEPVTIVEGDRQIGIRTRVRSWNWPGPYDILVDAAQYEEGPPTRWQVGGIPRANETLSNPVEVPESWTNLLLWAPECRSEWYANSGNQWIKTWYKDADNYVELYFDPSDNTFALQAVVEGIAQTPIKTYSYTFYRNGVIRFAIRSDETALRLSVAAAAPFEHVSGPPVDFLRSAILISKTGDHNGTGIMSCTMLADKLYDTVLTDNVLRKF